MAYSVGNYPNPGQSCPATHPVALPQVSYHIDYPLWPETLGPDGDSREWFLASDHYAVTSSQPGGYSAHGDWFMAWDPQVMATWVQNCINEERHCANGDLGNGFRLASLVPGVGNTSTAPIAASVP
jgi:hypothetical protein